MRWITDHLHIGKMPTIFDPISLDKLVKAELVNVPEDHKTAVVAIVHRDENGRPVAQVAFAYKPADNWVIQSYAELAKGNDVKDTYGLNYGASVQWSK